MAGLELTQSIQYNGAVGVSYGDDNSIPLVALKPLVVRAYAYVQPGIAEPDTLTGARVTGELVLSVGDRVVYRTGPTRAGAGIAVSVTRRYERLAVRHFVSGQWHAQALAAIAENERPDRRLRAAVDLFALMTGKPDHGGLFSLTPR